MAEWTDDATEYLDGYLRQVAALARRNGDDVDEIMGGLREHIEQKASMGGVESVDLDLLLEVLAEVGSPSEVMAVDGLGGIPRPHQIVKVDSIEETETVEKPLASKQSTNAGRRLFDTTKWTIASVSLVLLFVAGIVTVAVFIAEDMRPTVTTGESSLNAVPDSVLYQPFNAGQDKAGNGEANITQPDTKGACANNLKQVAQAFIVYAEDNEGRYPSLVDGSGGVRGFQIDNIGLYPDYLEDETYLICPAAEESNDDGVIVITSVGGTDSYVYPYMATRSLAEWQQDFLMRFGGVVGSELKGEPLPEGAEQMLFGMIDESEAASIPLIIERPGHHVPDGGHVLYLDGHVEFIKMGAKYPMVPDFFEELVMHQSVLVTLNSAIEQQRIDGN